MISSRLENASRMLFRTKGTENEARWTAEVVYAALEFATTERARLDAEAAARRPAPEDDAVTEGVFVLSCNRGVRLVVYSRGWTGSTAGEGGRDMTPEQARSVARQLLQAAGPASLTPEQDRSAARQLLQVAGPPASQDGPHEGSREPAKP